MNRPAEAERGASLALAGGLLALIGAELAFHLTVAWNLAADYYDATDYLINARFLAGNGSWFEGVRPPLVSLLDLPFFVGGAAQAWRGPHVLATVISYAALAASFALLARSLGTVRALAATALLAFSRLFVHYAPFVMADLLGTAAVAAALALHLASRERGGTLARLGVAVLTTLAVAARHPLAVLGPFLVGFEVFESLRARRVTAALRAPGFWAATVLPIPVFVVGMVAIFRWRLGWDVEHGLRALADVVTSQADKSGITTRVTESRLEYLEALVVSFRWPVVVLMGVGTFRAMVRGSVADRANALWFVANLALYSLVISRRESRYLLPAIPSAVSLAAVALSALEARLTPRPLAGGWRPRGVAALGLGLWVAAAAPLVPGVITEVSAFRDPVYTDPFAQRVAERAGALLRPPGRLLVVGDKYAVHPRDYRFTDGDEYYYFHHVAPRWFHYWLGSQVTPVSAPASVPEDRWLRFPRLLEWAAPGDVLVVLEPDTYQTRVQPAHKRPLTVARVWAGKADRDSEGRCDAYRGARAAVELCPSAGGLEVRVHSAAPVEIYAPEGQTFVSRGWFAPTPAGSSGGRGWEGAVPGSLMLASYDSAVAECPPTRALTPVASLADGSWPGPGVCPILGAP
ncbi:MAG: hypothetical protein IPK07_08950 [Deltaproteobacteria bacterium]|nr:hypothetical protein [Deltaproteobacteria bacterium]